MNFERCLTEFGDICMLCGRTDDDDFDNENDRCKFDEKKKSDRECEGFYCGEQCRLCSPLCDKLNI